MLAPRHRGAHERGDEIGEGGDHPPSVDVLVLLALRHPAAEHHNSERHSAGGPRPEEELRKAIGLPGGEKGEEHKADGGHAEGGGVEGVHPLLADLVGVEGGAGHVEQRKEPEPHARHNGEDVPHHLVHAEAEVRLRGHLPGSRQPREAHGGPEVADGGVLDGMEVLAGHVVGLDLVREVDGGWQAPWGGHRPHGRGPFAEGRVGIVPVVGVLRPEVDVVGVHRAGHEPEADTNPEEDAAHTEVEECLHAGGAGEPREDDGGGDVLLAVEEDCREGGSYWMEC
mmetsp:Transcript_13648/g.43044  ORF Transcript_13648/g.43044 Transcript_13648/m.43044 type:complete len:283 (+) Transcript_13648:676-1524(+)